MILIFFTPRPLTASICKKVAENIYNLKPSNFHRLCLMNEFSETPAHYVNDCKKNPRNFFLEIKKYFFLRLKMRLFAQTNTY